MINSLVTGGLYLHIIWYTTFSLFDDHEILFNYLKANYMIIVSVKCLIDILTMEFLLQ